MKGLSLIFLPKTSSWYLLFILCLQVYEQEVQILLKVLTGFD